MSDQPIKNLGWQVTIAGVGINLALGILYTWSIISKGIPDEWGWSDTDKSLPYAVACLVFSMAMVPAGRMQDKLSPKISASIGGILVGIGMIVASMTSDPIGFTIGFGVLVGAGIGFGYASATPPAVKWFPSAKTGMIAGIVVSGFGLASLYAAPLCKWMIGAYGLPTTIMYLGIGFFIVVVGFAQLLVAPPKDYEPEGSAQAKSSTAAPVSIVNTAPTAMLKTPQFYMIWFLYACGAGAGLMILSKLAKISGDVGVTETAIVVAAIAVGNGAGRILAGIASDKIGRKITLFICFVLQAATIYLLSTIEPETSMASLEVLCVVAAIIGANYGANLAIFPSITKDFFGPKNFGINYGLIFTAWGLGGFTLALYAGKVYDRTGELDFAYNVSSGLLIFAALLSLALKPPKTESPTEAEA